MIRTCIASDGDHTQIGFVDAGMAVIPISEIIHMDAALTTDRGGSCNIPRPLSGEDCLNGVLDGHG